MDEQELAGRKEEIEARLEVSGLADKCVRVATKFGKDRDSKQRDCYTNLDYLFEGEGLKIDCNIGCNIQGNGRLFVELEGRTVFKISNSWPYSYPYRKDLPIATAQSIGHKVLVYEPGDWEKRIEELASA